MKIGHCSISLVEEIKYAFFVVRKLSVHKVNVNFFFLVRTMKIIISFYNKRIHYWLSNKFVMRSKFTLRIRIESCYVIIFRIYKFKVLSLQ